MVISLLITGLYGVVISYLYIKARIKQAGYLNEVRILDNMVKMLQKQRDNNVVDISDADRVWNNFEK